MPARTYDALTGALIGLGRATEGNEDLIDGVLDTLFAEALAAPLRAADANAAALEERIEAAKKALVPRCYYCASPCGRNDAYDMEQLHGAPEALREKKYALLGSMRAAADLALRSGGPDRALSDFFYKALFAFGRDENGEEVFDALAGELGTLCPEAV